MHLAPPSKEWLQKDLPADIHVSMGHLHSDLSDCGTVEANLTFKGTPGGRDPRGEKWKLKKQWRPGVAIDTRGIQCGSGQLMGQRKS